MASEARWPDPAEEAPGRTGSHAIASPAAVDRGRCALAAALDRGGLVLLESPDRHAASTILQQVASTLGATALLVDSEPIGPERLARSVFGALGRGVAGPATSTLARISEEGFAGGRPLALLFADAEALPEETVRWLAQRATAAGGALRVALAYSDQATAHAALAGAGVCIELIRLEMDSHVSWAAPHSEVASPSDAAADARARPDLRAGSPEAALVAEVGLVRAEPSQAPEVRRVPSPPRPDALETDGLRTVEEILGEDAWLILERRHGASPQVYAANAPAEPTEPASGNDPAPAPAPLRPAPRKPEVARPKATSPTPADTPGQTRLERPRARPPAQEREPPIEPPAKPRAPAPTARVRQFLAIAGVLLAAAFVLWALATARLERNARGPGDLRPAVAVAPLDSSGPPSRQAAPVDVTPPPAADRPVATPAPRAALAPPAGTPSAQADERPIEDVASAIEVLVDSRDAAAWARAIAFLRESGPDAEAYDLLAVLDARAPRDARETTALLEARARVRGALCAAWADDPRGEAQVVLGCPGASAVVR